MSRTIHAVEAGRRMATRPLKRSGQAATVHTHSALARALKPKSTHRKGAPHVQS
jgi:hypothetical protein